MIKFKRFILILLLGVLFSSCFDSFSQITEPRFMLFETNNIWTFIQLDTATGRMWQIQFVVEGDNRGGVTLNSQDLSGVGQLSPGRFTLYPTNNVWTFILLDQVNGNTWQVQWSQEEDMRGIIGRIYQFQ